MQSHQNGTRLPHIDSDSVSHFNTQSFTHLKASQPKIALKKLHVPSAHAIREEDHDQDIRESDSASQFTNQKHNRTQSHMVKSNNPSILNNNQQSNKVEQVKQGRVFDENVVLIKPQIDASDKEIYARNGYRTAAKNLVNFLESGNRGQFIENIFKPKYLGDFTSDNQGVIKTIQQNKIQPDYDLPYKEQKLHERLMKQSQTPQNSSGKAQFGKLNNQNYHSGSKLEPIMERGDRNFFGGQNDDDSEDDVLTKKQVKDPWVRVEVRNSPESLQQYAMEQQRYRLGYGGKNQKDDMRYKEESQWKNIKEKRSKIVFMDKNKRMRKLIKTMERDPNPDAYELRQREMKVYQQLSDNEKDEDYDSEESRESKKQKKRNKKRRDSQDSQLSDMKMEKLKEINKRSNFISNYDDYRKDVNADSLKKGEFVSKNGKIVKPDRTDERQVVVKKKDLNEDDMRAYKEKELMREKLKNQNIVREVLKKQVKEKQEQKNFKPNDEIEALLIEKYKKEAKKIRVGNKEDQEYYLRRQALIDKVLLKNNKAIKSLAEKKRLWVGEEGQFAKKDLAKWYKVYNQTKLAEMREIFDKDNDGYNMQDLAS
ncbi:UNKNOWN [Stylonychia lemnae]|uniref:Uncharacterized protein n=1 Tax=Stylonychia lemnae TaxID=5949 RepID=A0A078B2W9_STYLE|nr:UNKNOWN [Stylonychia lemnae]|eukprot:CDW88586.1 UNKNOWN [Stylonychia lemnae]